MFLIWAIVASGLILFQIAGIVSLPIWLLVLLILAPGLLWLVIMFVLFALAGYALSRA